MDHFMLWKEGNDAFSGSIIIIFSWIRFLFDYLSVALVRSKSASIVRSDRNPVSVTSHCRDRIEPRHTCSQMAYHSLQQNQI
jgi:hypothetical protein